MNSDNYKKEIKNKWTSKIAQEKINAIYNINLYNFRFV